MQYILSQEEYDDLKARKSLDLKMEKKKLQELCTKIATTMPIKFWGGGEARPWGCPKSGDSMMEYCDECPVQDICPNDYKEWSQ